MAEPAAPRLRSYQWAPFRAILDSALHGKGMTFVVTMSRQAGKNELSARLEAVLLIQNMAHGGTIVKAAPTFRPQAINSMLRIQDRLRDFGLERLVHKSQGYILQIGRARAIFMGAGEESNIVGATASLLLEVDEAQDVSVEKFDRDLRPMAASTNATTVLYGTPWADDSLLELTRQRCLEQAAKDATQRVFEADWRRVGQDNPPYLTYVAGELERFGGDEEHPLFRTQYGLKLAFSGGGLFSEAQLARLQGQHARQLQPEPGTLYVAGLDLGGEADDTTEPSRRQDSTALTIARVRHERGRAPLVELVTTYTWRGTAHSALAEQLVTLLGPVWHVRRAVIDATGLGHTLAHALAERLGSRIDRFVFTGASKSQLGFDLLAAASAGTLTLWADDTPQRSELLDQLHKAKGKLLPGGKMAWFVPEADGHDDLLMSLGLCLHAALDTAPRAAVGR